MPLPVPVFRRAVPALLAALALTAGACVGERPKLTDEPAETTTTDAETTTTTESAPEGASAS